MALSSSQLGIKANGASEHVHSLSLLGPHNAPWFSERRGSSFDPLVQDRLQRSTTREPSSRTRRGATDQEPEQFSYDLILHALKLRTEASIRKKEHLEAKREAKKLHYHSNRRNQRSDSATSDDTNNNNHNVSISAHNRSASKDNDNNSSLVSDWSRHPAHTGVEDGTDDQSNQRDGEVIGDSISLISQRDSVDVRSRRLRIHPRLSKQEPSSASSSTTTSTATRQRHSAIMSSSFVASVLVPSGIVTAPQIQRRLPPSTLPLSVDLLMSPPPPRSAVTLPRALSAFAGSSLASPTSGSVSHSQPSAALATSTLAAASASSSSSSTSTTATSASSSTSPSSSPSLPAGSLAAVRKFSIRGRSRSSSGGNGGSSGGSSGESGGRNSMVGLPAGVGAGGDVTSVATTTLPSLSARRKLSNHIIIASASASANNSNNSNRRSSTAVPTSPSPLQTPSLISAPQLSDHVPAIDGKANVSTEGVLDKQSTIDHLNRAASNTVVVPSTLPRSVQLPHSTSLMDLGTGMKKSSSSLNASQRKPSSHSHLIIRALHQLQHHIVGSPLPPTPKMAVNRSPVPSALLLPLTTASLGHNHRNGIAELSAVTTTTTTTTTTTSVAAGDSDNKGLSVPNQASAPADGSGSSENSQAVEEAPSRLQMQVDPAVTTRPRSGPLHNSIFVDPGGAGSRAGSRRGSASAIAANQPSNCLLSPSSSALLLPGSLSPSASGTSFIANPVFLDPLLHSSHSQEHISAVNSLHSSAVPSPRGSEYPLVSDQHLRTRSSASISAFILALEQDPFFLPPTPEFENLGGIRSSMDMDGDEEEGSQEVSERRFPLGHLANDIPITYCYEYTQDPGYDLLFYSEDPLVCAWIEKRLQSTRMPWQGIAEEKRLCVLELAWNNDCIYTPSPTPSPTPSSSPSPSHSPPHSPPLSPRGGSKSSSGVEFRDIPKAPKTGSVVFAEPLLPGSPRTRNNNNIHSHVSSGDSNNKVNTDGNRIDSSNQESEKEGASQRPSSPRNFRSITSTSPHSPQSASPRTSAIRALTKSITGTNNNPPVQRANSARHINSTEHINTNTSSLLGRPRFQRSSSTSRITADGTSNSNNIPHSHEYLNSGRVQKYVFDGQDFHKVWVSPQFVT